MVKSEAQELRMEPMRRAKMGVSQPACWKSKGIVTRPGPVILEKRRETEPRKDIPSSGSVI